MVNQDGTTRIPIRSYSFVLKSKFVEHLVLTECVTIIRYILYGAVCNLQILGVLMQVLSRFPLLWENMEDQVNMVLKYLNV